MDFSFNPEIARLTHCADEATFVHRVYFLVRNNAANGRNFHDGKYWTYDSLQALSKIFDFWTPRQLRRIIRNCQELGLIETGHFAENTLDRRTWYTITEKVKSIYANGQNDLTERSNVGDETGKCQCPNGQMIYKEQLEDQLKDQLEGAPAKKQRKQPERQRCGEFGNVLLSDTELDKLRSRWEPGQVEQEIEALSAYMASKGKRYSSHYATLLNWLKRDHPQDRGKAQDGRGRADEWI